MCVLMYEVVYVLIKHSQDAFGLLVSRIDIALTFLVLVHDLVLIVNDLTIIQLVDLVYLHSLKHW